MEWDVAACPISQTDLLRRSDIFVFIAPILTLPSIPKPGGAVYPVLYNRLKMSEIFISVAPLA